ncbi:type II toxin-antitoxin system RelE/ParE family toxin [Pseudomonas aeruginosa]|uniref:type II toxin-antitoxin system RelE/ParE family toxin n=1 Tax=Pseudomonas aeruginosa TaxID=287 RepID=UPI00313986CF|nr:type II toxin-antitoxin system RelE/ParE family toxin [Pseudomonas aeruginosa]HBP5996327.1 type II toxin-antitoxin system RelE/ParE family toxin [Pseudomonas aeruginosa]
MATAGENQLFINYLFIQGSTVNREAAARTVQQLTSAPTALLTNPRLGERLEEFEPRDVRRILIGHYEMRYEILDSCIYVLRLWHTREDR